MGVFPPSHRGRGVGGWDGKGVLWSLVESGCRNSFGWKEPVLYPDAGRELGELSLTGLVLGGVSHGLDDQGFQFFRGSFLGLAVGSQSLTLSIFFPRERVVPPARMALRARW